MTGILSNTHRSSWFLASLVFAASSPLLAGGGVRFDGARQDSVYTIEEATFSLFAEVCDATMMPAGTGDFARFTLDGIDFLLGSATLGAIYSVSVCYKASVKDRSDPGRVPRSTVTATSTDIAGSSMTYFTLVQPLMTLTRSCSPGNSTGTVETLYHRRFTGGAITFSWDHPNNETCRITFQWTESPAGGARPNTHYASSLVLGLGAR